MIREKKIHIIAFTISLFILDLYLYIFDIAVSIILFINIIIVAAFLIPIIIEIFQKRKKRNNINEIIKKIDKKSLLPEFLDMDQTSDERFYFEIIEDICRYFNDELGQWKKECNDYRDYIELWVHEIKTPVMAAKLICENTGNTSINEELKQIEDYIEQVLYYAKAWTLEEDLKVERINLKEIISKVIRNNAKVMIQEKIVIDLFEEEVIVFGDKKWLYYIINQIISNSIKYIGNNERKIMFSITLEKDRKILNISDTGIGIDEKDVKYVFNKGFTGENGRIFAKSTGMGLYLCKKLCEKMGMNISIESKKNIGTSVSIIFPEGSMTKM